MFSYGVFNELTHIKRNGASEIKTQLYSICIMYRVYLYAVLELR